MSESAPIPSNTDQTIPNSIESLQEGKVSLEFLQQEPSQDYSALIDEAEKAVHESFTGNKEALVSNYDRVWFAYALNAPAFGRTEPVIEKELDEALPGSVVCDLGGGLRMSLVAASRNAELFMNVNKYPEGVDHNVNTDPTTGNFKKNHYKDVITKTELVPGEHKTITVQADMLDFVSRLKDESVNISINGIDTDLVSIESYHEAVAREILRVLKPNGIAFGNNAEPLHIIGGWIKTNPEVAERFSTIYGQAGVTIVKRK